MLADGLIGFAIVSTSLAAPYRWRGDAYNFTEIANCTDIEYGTMFACDEYDRETNLSSLAESDRNETTGGGREQTTDDVKLDNANHVSKSFSRTPSSSDVETTYASTYSSPETKGTRTNRSSAAVLLAGLLAAAMTLLVGFLCACVWKRKRRRLDEGVSTARLNDSARDQFDAEKAKISFRSRGSQNSRLDEDNLWSRQSSTSPKVRITPDEQGASDEDQNGANRQTIYWTDCGLVAGYMLDSCQPLQRRSPIYVGQENVDGLLRPAGLQAGNGWVPVTDRKSSTLSWLVQSSLDFDKELVELSEMT